MLESLRAFKDVENDIEIIRILKRYQATEFAEVFDQEQSTLQKF